jgi:NADH:ubiquinone oxidoreductase subunit 5 (subunit L)/multisubunit Na+/H+ antiporter MnhA subunit
MAVTSALLTAVYSIRLLEQVFWTYHNGYKAVLINHVKSSPLEILVLGFLAVLSLFTGYFFKDTFTGFGSNYFNQFVHALPAGSFGVESEFLPFEVKLTPALLTVFATEIESRFFECKWFYNEVINGCFTLPVLIAGRHVFEQHEKIMLEQNGPIFVVIAIKALFNSPLRYQPQR